VNWKRRQEMVCKQKVKKKTETTLGGSGREGIFGSTMKRKQNTKTTNDDKETEHKDYQ
jgi:hypothetical protein